MWRSNNRARCLAANQRYRQKNKEFVNQIQRTWRYGLLPAQWEQLLQSYGHRCAVCGSRKRLCLDEFHKVPRWTRRHEQARHKWNSLNRGVLCNRCNNAIGLLGESTRIVLRAKHYVLRPPAYTLPDLALRRWRPKWLHSAPGLAIGRLLTEQRWRCAVCTRQLPEDLARCHTDHKPGTRKVRGVLCRYCNPGIGLLNDDVNQMQRAVHYVRYWRTIHDIARARGLRRGKRARAAQILEIHLTSSGNTERN